MRKLKKGLFYTRIIKLLFILQFFGFVLPVHAVNVVLQWTPNIESTLAGYRVFSREKGQPYDYTNPSLEVTEASGKINNLDENITYYFVVRAFDFRGFESGDSNEVCLEAVSSSGNRPPTAVITQDYIEAVPGTTVKLDGSRSTDTDDGIASYHWSQIDGPPVTLSNHSSKTVTFTAPETDQYGTNLTFRLTIRDFGGLQSTADCSVYISLYKPFGGPNQAPRVDAGFDQIITLMENIVFLDGTLMDDGLPDPPAAMTTIWYQAGGQGTANFFDAKSVDTIARFSEPGTYVLYLIAYDGEYISGDSVTITVMPWLYWYHK